MTIEVFAIKERGQGQCTPDLGTSRRSFCRELSGRVVIVIASRYRSSSIKHAQRADGPARPRKPAQLPSTCIRPMNPGKSTACSVHLHTTRGAIEGRSKQRGSQVFRSRRDHSQPGRHGQAIPRNNQSMRQHSGARKLLGMQVRRHQSRKRCSS